MQFDRVVNGVVKYIETEMYPKVGNLQQFGLGIFVGRLARDTSILKNMEFVKLLKIVDENDEVDIDMLKEDIMMQINKVGKLDMDIPFIGRFTFNPADAEMLFRKIKEC